jgi:hypothetical protein
MALHTALLAALLLLAPSMALLAGPGRQSCNIEVNVMDPDPAGANLRASPGGKVLKRLRASGSSDAWVSVHAIAQLGDWIEIDGAMLNDPELPSGQKPLYRGRGYLHRGVLGFDGLQNGATIYSDHDKASRPIDDNAPGDQKVTFLGCWSDFFHIRVAKGVGWTHGACLNMLTTCS